MFARLGGEHDGCRVKRGIRDSCGISEGWGRSSEDQWAEDLKRQILSSKEEELSGPFNAL